MRGELCTSIHCSRMHPVPRFSWELERASSLVLVRLGVEGRVIRKDSEWEGQVRAGHWV